MQGFGPEGAVNNIQNVHETSVQDTALFITMVEGGSTTQPLRATTGPNVGGESNFFYTSNADELTVENIQVEGNINVVGTVTADSFIGSGSADFHMNSDQMITFGNTTGSEYVRFGYVTGLTSMQLQANTDITTSFVIRNFAGANRADFNLQTGELTMSGDINANSDERLKENIETIDNALEKVSQMRGVYFDLKEQPGVRKTGVIAQEVERVLPEVVKTSEEGDQIKSVAYANMVGVLIEAVKELKAEVDQLKNQ